jgi:hypothetical protein
VRAAAHLEARGVAIAHIFGSGQERPRTQRTP